MKKSYLFVVVSLLIAVSMIMGGCAAPAATPQVLTFTDGLGRSVTLAKTPEKIVSLAPSNTEILFALGAGSQIVGRDEFSDYPEEAKSIQTIGGSMGKFSLEQITALKPDLVLAAEINTPEQVKAIEELGLTVYYLANPTDLDGLYTNLDTVGKLTGHEKEAGELVSASKARVEAALKKVEGKETVSVFYELDGSDAAKPWTVGTGTFADTLISMAGGKNIGATAGESWLQMSQEAIIAENPAVILLGDAAYGVTAETVASRAGWDQIAAVKNNQVVAFDDNLFSRPGPRLVDALEQLVATLHP